VRFDVILAEEYIVLSCISG